MNLAQEYGRCPEQTARADSERAVAAVTPSARNKRLDILRCVAVLVVVVHHNGAVPLLTKMGWVGVDLFFVLSGFLISGLLYSEYKEKNSIGFKRFLIRRGLKIYPAFYVMLLVTFVAEVILRDVRTPGAYLREILFVQSYAYGIWSHTWSLSVEEHFYIFLPIFLLLVMRCCSHRHDPFRVVPWAFVFIATACLLMRASTIYFTPVAAFRYQSVMNPTNDRMDALFFGVFLGCLHHFRPEIIEQLFRPARNRIAIAVLTALLLSCCFLFTRDSRFLLTFGLASFLYLGFGGLLLLSLHVQDVLPPRLATMVGKLWNRLRFRWRIFLLNLPVARSVRFVCVWRGPQGASCPDAWDADVYFQHPRGYRPGNSDGPSCGITCNPPARSLLPCDTEAASVGARWFASPVGGGPSRMRILIAAHVPNRREGGVAGIIYGTGEGLERRGHSVEYIFPGDLPTASFVSGRFKDFEFAVQLARFIRRDPARYSIVIIHAPWGWAYGLLRYFSQRMRKNGPAYVMLLHGLEERRMHAMKREAKKGKAFHFNFKNRLWQRAYHVPRFYFSIKTADHALCYARDVWAILQLGSTIWTPTRLPMHRMEWIEDFLFKENTLPFRRLACCSRGPGSISEAFSTCGTPCATLPRACPTCI